MLGLGTGIIKNKKLGSFKVSDVSEVSTWLKADTGVTQTSGVLDRWRDNVGTADWVCATSSRRPLVSGSGVNTKITFDKNDRVFQKDYAWTTSSGNDFDFPHDQFDVLNQGGSGFSLFWVTEIATDSTDARELFNEEHFVDDGAAGSPFTARTDISAFIPMFVNNTGLILIGGKDGMVAASGATQDINTQFPKDQKLLLTLEYKGHDTSDHVIQRTNGVNIDFQNQGDTGEPNIGDVHIGLFGDSSNGWIGDVYEIIICKSRVSESNRDKIEQYLMNRHSIS